VTLDVVVPFYNEASCVRRFVAYLIETLRGIEGVTPRYILVNDGSLDETGFILDALAAEHSCINVLHMWGNHGHQRALTAGLDVCDADLVLMLDGDGQHPPEVAASMVRVMMSSSDCDVVQAVRSGDQGGFFKNATSGMFYRILRWIMPDVILVPGASDFRVIRRGVVAAIKLYPDRYRNVRVLLASMGLETQYVPYQVAVRLGGSSGYGTRQMLKLAANGWFAFSSSPLRISILLMSFSGVVGFVYLLYVFVMFLIGKTVPGWTSIIAYLSFMFSAVFGVLAIMSEYVARIYEDVKGHPVYRLRNGTNVEKD
jgi:polyisoprenyl-phosphate glycosyltransferase